MNKLILLSYLFIFVFIKDFSRFFIALRVANQKKKKKKSNRRRKPAISIGIDDEKCYNFIIFRTCCGRTILYFVRR